MPNKDPAVLWYYHDFLVGTAFMSNEEVGCYTRILNHLFDKDALPEEDMLKICITSDIWKRIKCKFEQDPDGRWFNVRAREEKEKRVKYTTSRANNRKSKEYVPGDKKDMKNISTTSDEDMVNEDEDVNVNKDLNGKEKKVRSIFIRTWGYNIQTAHLLKVAVEMLDTYGEKKLVSAAEISSEYGKRSNFKYLKGVCEGLVHTETIKKIKDQELRLAAIKQQEKIFEPDPETAKIFRDMIKQIDAKSKTSYVPKNFDQKKRNEEFQKKVEKGEIK